MMIELGSDVLGFIANIREKHGTTIEIREQFGAGKSAEFVALVDCSGTHDGVYVLKVDTFPAGRIDEETRQKEALAAHAFSGKLPTLVLSERSETHYCLLMKIAGGSRLTWRPLVGSLGLFRSAYSSFAAAAWTPGSFAFGKQEAPAKLLAAVVGYKLSQSEGGRITANVSRFIGRDFVDRPAFVHHDRILPNARLPGSAKCGP